ncbi:response regulator receiver protein [Solidesulfovibrio carbinoliphilus subsp. oakridgensis]|uniref:Response regulator receiver protein n=1 Tax=Solidesulfovibrio carbinoliphilus subsp. oakridgensis TaxID=694327 RepID=G7QB22_9BACT|nr:response regulator [Solidesulfovibrio carbinoliphilus]EHJ48764.1 response regulator receiver protein [Solidesulfovibrio carbinoliphilus subsp. oakridgensis]
MPTPNTSEKNPNAPARRRLLILDDEPIVVKRLKPAFQKAGYDVSVFTDSAAALAAFEAAPADIVITDLKMEGMDGIGFLDRIKAVSPGVGVIVITGFATLETAKESFHKGAFDFVAKPFKLADILDVVARLESMLPGAPHAG